jgi:hypothetical protein
MLLYTYIPENRVVFEFAKLVDRKSSGKLYEDLLVLFEKNFIENVGNVPTKKLKFWNKFDIVIS